MSDMHDDGLSLDIEWLTTQATRQEDRGYWDVPPSGDVWWECGIISFAVDSVEYDPGEWETVATNWRVDGEILPKALIPRTRGEFRRLCVMANGVPQ